MRFLRQLGGMTSKMVVYKNTIKLQFNLSMYSELSFIILD